MEQNYPNTLSGIGTDIVEIKRIKRAILRHGNRFIDRLFTEKEKAYCQKYRDPIPHYAGRFAAKEAAIKALGRGPKDFKWQEIEILNDTYGKPEIRLSARLQKTFRLTKFFITISHCKTFATATAIFIGA